MTVRKSERSEGKLQVLDLTRKLLVHTIRLCKNERSFPKAQRWIFTKRLVDEAMLAYCCVREANATLLRASPTLDVDYRYRRERQVEAHAHLVSLMGLMDVAHELGNVGDSMGCWAGLATDANERLKAWMASDMRRYQRLCAGASG